MFFETQRKDFIEALKTVIACVPKNAVMPILKNVLIETGENKVTITGYNLDQRINASFSARVEKQGTTSLPAHKLLNLLNKFTHNFVSIETDTENHASKISCGTALVNIVGLSPDEYPKANKETPITTFSIDTKDFLLLFTRGGYAVSLDDSRKVLQGVLFNFNKDSLTLVSTDGKRLTSVDYYASINVEKNLQYIVPISALAMISRFKGEKIELAFGEKSLCATVGDIELQTKLIDGQYPNYKQVVPVSSKNKLELNTEEFLAKLSIVSTMIDEVKNYAVLTFTGETLKFSVNSSSGAITDSMTIDTNFTAPIELQLNANFLSQAVSSCGERVFEFNFDNEKSPVLLDFLNNSKTAIMPISRKNQ